MTTQTFRRLLSLAELRALPDGTEVTVHWEGGNGPHDYQLTRRAGGIGVQVPHPRPVWHSLETWPITTDAASPHTKVWRRERT